MPTATTLGHSPPWRKPGGNDVQIPIAAHDIWYEESTMDKQTAYVESLSAEIVELDAQIELLKDKAKSDQPGTTSEYSNTIAALQLKRDEAALKLQGIATVSEHEWDDVKSGADDTLDEVRTMVRDTITKIK